MIDDAWEIGDECKRPTNPIFSRGILVAGVFRLPVLFFPRQGMVRSDQWWRSVVVRPVFMWLRSIDGRGCWHSRR